MYMVYETSIYLQNEFLPVLKKNYVECKGMRMGYSEHKLKRF